MTVHSKVQRGIDLLDRTTPGWRERINTATLCVADRSQCVLGQLFGDYQIGLNVVGLVPEGRLWPGSFVVTCDLGFSVVNEGGMPMQMRRPPVMNPDEQEVNDEWVRRIKEQ